MTNVADTTPASNMSDTTPKASETVVNNTETEQHITVQNETEEQAEPQVLFQDFDLHPKLHKALDEMGFASPTEVQEQTLEIALKGKDLMVSAQTGSGKTIAFLLPCIAHVLDNLPPKKDGWHKKARPQVLVVCPTRELVEQVTQDAIKLVKFAKGMRVSCIMGGMPYGKQLAGLKGARVVVATPGRLLDLAERGQIDLTHVTHMVLDEADRMLDLGFQEDLASISKLCKSREQTLLFSATFADNIVGLAENLMNEPERITLARTQDKHADITQSLYYADNNDHKAKLLNHWLETEEINQAVIFVPTQVECDSLTERLREEGQNVINLHGGMRQFMRMKRLKLVRNGRVKLLVATDVAARGLDVPNISHVINYGLPMKHEDYVHRIGRTGRAGRKGNAITVATHRERGRVRALQQFIAQDIEVLEVEGLEPSPPPPRDRKGRKGRGGKEGGRGRRRNRNDSRDGNRHSRGNGDNHKKDGFKKEGFKKDNYRDDKRHSDKRNFDRQAHDKPRFDKPRKDVDGNSKSYHNDDRGHYKSSRRRNADGFNEQNDFVTNAAKKNGTRNKASNNTNDGYKARKKPRDGGYNDKSSNHKSNRNGDDFKRSRNGNRNNGHRDNRKFGDKGGFRDGNNAKSFDKPFNPNEDVFSKRKPKKFGKKKPQRDD